MTDEQKPQPTHFSEMIAIHAISAALVTVFFRWQASRENWWNAGDESLIANGIGAVFDIAYWLFKPRILRWRNSR